MTQHTNPVPVTESDPDFLRDLAGRLFRNATPALGFDQGDTDRLYRIAHRLASTPADASPRGEAVEQLAYFVENPSAWENFDQKASDAIAAALPALNAGEREKRAFNHGYLIAVSTMLHQHDEPVMAEDALRDAGLQWDTVKKLGLDEFDLKVLRPVFREIERKDTLPNQPAATEGKDG